MSTLSGLAVAGLSMGLNAVAADAQTVASLPFNMPQTAGPNGTNYEAPEDARDLWIIEDFSISRAAILSRFELLGTVFPAPTFVFDVTASHGERLCLLPDGIRFR